MQDAWDETRVTQRDARAEISGGARRGYPESQPALLMAVRKPFSIAGT